MKEMSLEQGFLKNIFLFLLVILKQVLLQRPATFLIKEFYLNSKKLQNRKYRVFTEKRITAQLPWTHGLKCCFAI